MSSAKPRGSYGIDAPWVPWMLAGFTLVYAVLTVLGVLFWNLSPLSVVVLGIITVLMAASAAIYWHTSLRGKFVLWDRLLAMIELPEGGKALDLGCGHGMVAVMIALRWPEITVTGTDLWRSVDQSGNTAAAAVRNAEINGVSDRVQFDTGDMTHLPYPDGTFQFVTASLAIHNIPTRDGRRQAITEAARVLVAGGSILIADIRRVTEYRNDLAAAGLAVTEPEPLGWRGWWGGPWMATTAITAYRVQAEPAM
ncbi:class I SAM-dependent methyltransferase [Arthrobacter sp.]|uniref:class I SAM-dependent methyltransferase n=1 Tax=Arthrobacter sp. TaxID=1667 RepID=UPI0026DF143D|nr:class I SAM-dependent methyltransferase [Arthrobacter sp.]MDO5753958.1 class I SAM-dependent methyltransferase [Arthrobacter sp.]